MEIKEKEKMIKFICYDIEEISPDCIAEYPIDLLSWNRPNSDLFCITFNNDKMPEEIAIKEEVLILDKWLLNTITDGTIQSNFDKLEKYFWDNYFLRKDDSSSVKVFYKLNFAIAPTSDRGDQLGKCFNCALVIERVRA